MRRVQATYTLTQDDIDGGVTIQNCVVVATDPTAANNCVTDNVEGEPGLEIDKTSETITDIDLGETITYEFAVTNTGNVTLYDVDVNDPMLVAAGVTVPMIDQLDPGQTLTVSADYTVTADRRRERLRLQLRDSLRGRNGVQSGLPPHRHRPEPGRGDLEGLPGPGNDHPRRWVHHLPGHGDQYR